jgi:hypothetical protein
LTSVVPSYYKKVAIIGAIVTLALAVSIVFYFGQTSGSPKIAIETIDSSSCIACHTDETVIAQSTFGQDVVVAEASGG